MSCHRLEGLNVSYHSARRIDGILWGLRRAFRTQSESMGAAAGGPSKNWLWQPPTVMFPESTTPQAVWQLRLRRANRQVRFSPSREPEPFEHGLPCPPDQQWPNALRAAGGDPMSKPRLHTASTHTRVTTRAKLGRVFFHADDRVLANAHGLALLSISSRGGCPASSSLL